ncbi:MAG TPA: hypothetical protein VGC42_16860 [Kofleriaceae bacterium]
MRQDAHGNCGAVVDELTESEARLLTVSYAARGHARYLTERTAPAPSSPEASAPIYLPTLINERVADDDN